MTDFAVASHPRPGYLEAAPRGGVFEIFDNLAASFQLPSKLDGL
jgi:hypothetical protein